MNTSTSGASSVAFKADVPRATCRMAHLQFLDADSVPLIVDLGGGPINDVQISTNAISQVSFFSSYADCINNATPSSVVGFSFLAGSSISSSGFAYKVTGAAVTDFCFTSTYLGTPGYQVAPNQIEPNFFGVSP